MSIRERPADARDRAFIRRALDLARRGWGQTAPNPMVGAVVVQGDEVVGEGFHARYGEAHAEPVALRAAGEQARGATVYVSLEPCNHHGQTPPCVDALIAAGVRRVVCAVADPNPKAVGGAARLRAAGIEVTVGIEEAEARELNAPFFFAQRAERPWVTLKLALSLDGALTDARRSSAWLTGPPARAEVHHLRAANDAIAVGAGTVLTDDPELTVRHAPPPRVPPRRVVFDDRLETPPTARLLAPPLVAPVSIVSIPRAAGPEAPGTGRGTAAADDGSTAAARARALAEAGADVVPAASLAEALVALRRRGVRSLLVEGGAGLAGALLEAALVDRLVIFQAPVILGQGALNAFARAPAHLVAGAPRLPILERRLLGDDLMTVFALTPL